MKTYAPIVLFVYNRPDLTLKTIESLKRNILVEKSNIYIYSDGFKNEKDKEKVEKVREIIKDVQGFNSVKVIERNENKGLATSVIEGVTEVIKKYGTAIVMEDDLLTSPYFLTYMNLSLKYYENDKNIWSVSGYTPIKINDIVENKDIYFSGRSSSWGWATWEKKWMLNNWSIESSEDIFTNSKIQKNFNKYGNDLFPMLKDYKRNYVDSWAIRWCYNQFLHQSLTVYPSESLVFNDGLANLDSTHGGFSKNQFKLTDKKKFNFIGIYHDKGIENRFKRYYDLKLHNYVGFFLKKIGVYKEVKARFKKIQLIINK